MKGVQYGRRYGTLLTMLNKSDARSSGEGPWVVDSDKAKIRDVIAYGRAL